jgi:hypothetical protein
MLWFDLRISRRRGCDPSCDLTFIKLVRIYGVDRGEGFGEVERWRFGGDQGVAASLDCDGAVVAGGAYDR